jgi:hypothetical protein
VRDRKCPIEHPSTDSESSRRADAFGTRRNVIRWRYECVTPRGRCTWVLVSSAITLRTRFRWTPRAQILRALEAEKLAALDGRGNCAVVADLHPWPDGVLAKSRNPPRRAFFVRIFDNRSFFYEESDATLRLSVRSVRAKLLAWSPEPHDW